MTEATAVHLGKYHLGTDWQIWRRTYPGLWYAFSKAQLSDLMCSSCPFIKNALQLPPCHVVGVSIGSCVALEMAISHPNQVLSLFMISPLSLTEVCGFFSLISFTFSQMASIFETSARRCRRGPSGDIRVLGGWTQGRQS